MASRRRTSHNQLASVARALRSRLDDVQAALGRLRESRRSTAADVREKPDVALIAAALEDSAALCDDILSPARNRRADVVALLGADAALRALWVDNDARHVERLRPLFEDAGWRIDVATDMAVALRRFADRAYDVALLDVVMDTPPDLAGGTDRGALGGLNLARRFRKRRRGHPIVFISGFADVEVARWCRENPPAMVVTKDRVSQASVRALASLVRFGSNSALDDLEALLRRFPAYARTLARGHHQQPATRLVNERDAQQMLHGLLVSHYDDILAEEWTPQYAGGCARIDFVLPKEEIAIEVKLTRRSMTVRELGEQLLVDIRKYSIHPKVRHLLCFVIDAADIVRNEGGLTSDLEHESSGNLSVRLLVVRLETVQSA